MKAVMLSIQPYYVFLIIARLMGWDIPQEKTVEVRKYYPKDSAWNKKAHIYCSKNKKSFNRIPKQYQSLMARFLGKVIGEFVCDYIVPFRIACEMSVPVEPFQQSALSWKEFIEYAGGNSYIYGWHISDLKIYDKPKELGEFKHCCKHNRECDDCKYWGFQHVKKGGVELLCPIDIPLTRPPQSWCYVEELTI